MGGMVVALHSHALPRRGDSGTACAPGASGMAAQSGNHATRPSLRASMFAFSIGAVGFLLGACATSHEPHARMTAATIETRVEEEFPIGTPRDAVLLRLQRNGSTYDAPLPLEQPAGWTTLRLYMDQPWWAPLEWASNYSKTEAWADLLFDQSHVLREVQGEARERTW